MLSVRLSEFSAFACVSLLVCAIFGCSNATTSTTPGQNTPYTPGTLALSTSSVTVAQSAGTVALAVARTGGTSGAVTLAYATANGTAIAVTNYTNTSGILSWADGDATSKTITVPISTTTAFSSNITFNVTISAPTGSATLGSPSVETVTLTSAGPYAAYSSYYTIPYVGSPSLKSLGSSLLYISASIATTTTGKGTTASFILDSGSTGVVVPASEVAGYVNGTGTPGSITYTSSGLTLSGYYTNAVISFPTAVNQNGTAITATASLPVLAVTSATCSGNGINPCNTSIPHMLGIGFGRGTTTYASPVYNPFVNLTEMSAGTMRRGYTYTAAGIQLGLTNATVPLPAPFGNATTNYYQAEQLTASNAFPGYAYDWNTPTGSFVYNGVATASGTVLFDTGLTDMLIENAGYTSSNTVPNNTPITINAIPSLVSYSFNSGDGGPATPSSVNWASYTHGVFVNVGNHFLGKFDYLYDADGGILGLRPQSR